MKRGAWLLKKKYIKKVIRSCINVEQLETCKRWVKHLPHNSDQIILDKYCLIEGINARIKRYNGQRVT